MPPLKSELSNCIGTKLKINQIEILCLVDVGVTTSCLGEQFYKGHQGKLGQHQKCSEISMETNAKPRPDTDITGPVTIAWRHKEVSLLRMDLLAPLDIIIDTKQDRASPKESRIPVQPYDSSAVIPNHPNKEDPTTEKPTYPVFIMKKVANSHPLGTLHFHGGPHYHLH